MRSRPVTAELRLADLLGVLGARAAGHFGGPPVDYEGHDYPGDAAGALAQLDAADAAWTAGVRGLGAGPAGAVRATGWRRPW